MYGRRNGVVIIEAERMFDKLGFKKHFDNLGLHYHSGYFSSYNGQISFFADTKKMWLSRLDTIDYKLLKAINKQFEELEWDLNGKS